MAAAKISMISHRNSKFTAYDTIKFVCNGTNIMLDGRFGYYFVGTTAFIKRLDVSIFHKIRSLFYRCNMSFYFVYWDVFSCVVLLDTPACPSSSAQIPKEELLQKT